MSSHVHVNVNIAFFVNIAWMIFETGLIEMLDRKQARI